MPPIRKNEIRKKIQAALIDHDFIKKLAKVEDVCKDIWSSDVRLVKYYTDHGVEHSYRIIHYIFEILEKQHKTLNPEEYFILFCSAFLHDIGMQCDLNKHNHIKVILYDKDLTKLNFSHDSMSYTDEESEELRRLHNVISYYWIIEASKGKSLNNGFNVVMREIGNSLLIQDIADICLYHTKKDINKIEKNFNHDINNENKKALASLFRLADELDIDARRVQEIDQLNQYSYKDKSEFIWWVHSRIRVSFDKFGNVTLTISLNPSDKNYENIMIKKIERELNQKNKKLINIMKKEGFMDVTIASPQVKFSEAEELIPSKFKVELDRENNIEPKTKREPLIATKEIIPSMYHKYSNLRKKIIDGVMSYEIWEGDSGFPQYYLILGRKNYPDIWEDINTELESLKLEKIEIQSLIIVSLVQKVVSVEKNINLKIMYKIFHLHEFVWMFIVDKELKNIKINLDINHYTEQNLYDRNMVDDSSASLGPAYKYLYNQYILLNEKRINKPIFIQAHGGTGKSYLLEKLTLYINESTEKTKKLAFLVSSEKFMKNITKVNRNEKIDSIQKLLKVYASIIFGLTLNEKMISQAFFAGNLVILIDGIDEYISIYGDNFLIQDFFNSISDFNNDDLSNAKLIITSRLSPSIARLSKNTEMRNCVLKGFNDVSLKKYIENRLNGSETEHTKLFIAIKDFFEEDEQYSPFFIKTIIDVYEKEGEKFELKRTGGEARKDLVRYLLEREIVRQKYGIDIENVYKIFYNIALLMDAPGQQTLTKEDLNLATEKDDANFTEKLLINPLFRLSDEGETIAFKFSFVKNHFLAKYYISEFDKHTISMQENIENDFKNGFSKYNVGIGEIFQQLVENYKVSDNLNLDSGIKNILFILRKNWKDSLTEKRFTSALIHLLFKVYSDDDTPANLLRKAYNNISNYNKIYNLHMQGNFSSINFSNMKVIDSSFSNFSEIVNSTFNNETIFQNSVFEIDVNEISYNLQLTHSIFYDCERNITFLELCKNNKEYANKEIERLLEIFHNIIMKFKKNNELYPCNIFATDINWKDGKEVLSELVKIKFLVKDIHTRNSYEISNKYKKDVISIKTFSSGYSILLIDVIKKINYEVFGILNKDIDDFFTKS